MSVNNNTGLLERLVVENRVESNNRKRNDKEAPKTGTKQSETKGKWIIAGVTLSFLIVLAFILGLGANSSSGSIGGAIISWPGQVWQQLLQSSAGSTGTTLAQQSPWALARIGGIMAYIMSFFSVVLGLLISMRWKWVRNVFHPTVSFYLHRILALLAMSFLVMHLVGLALDSYLNISILNSFIPFSTSNYRPFWTGLGTLAVYGLVSVIITAYLANKLGYKVWRTVHYATFGIFYMCLIHGVMTGSDTNSLWMEVIYISSGLIVAGLTFMRFGVKNEKRVAKPVR